MAGLRQRLRARKTVRQVRVLLDAVRELIGSFQRGEPGAVETFMAGFLDDVDLEALPPGQAEEMFTSLVVLVELLAVVAEDSLKAFEERGGSRADVFAGIERGLERVAAEGLAPAAHGHSDSTATPQRKSHF